jgi:hypothetical protein
MSQMYPRAAIVVAAKVAGFTEKGMSFAEVVAIAFVGVLASLTMWFML